MNNTNNKNKIDSKEQIISLEKEKSHIIIEIVEYVPNAVMSRTIIKKSTGNVTAMSFSEGEELCEKNIPYDNYIQIIDGSAHLRINNKEVDLTLGQGIVIPAHSRHSFNAAEQFKMISTIIKSGYDE